MLGHAAAARRAARLMWVLLVYLASLMAVLLLYGVWALSNLPLPRAVQANHLTKKRRSKKKKKKKRSRSASTASWCSPAGCW